MNRTEIGVSRNPLNPYARKRLVDDKRLRNAESKEKGNIKPEGNSASNINSSEMPLVLDKPWPFQAQNGSSKPVRE